jgi:hypothetical protein
MKMVENGHIQLSPSELDAVRRKIYSDPSQSSNPKITDELKNYLGSDAKNFIGSDGNIDISKMDDKEVLEMVKSGIMKLSDDAIRTIENRLKKGEGTIPLTRAMRKYLGDDYKRYLNSEGELVLGKMDSELI